MQLRILARCFRIEALPEQQRDQLLRTRFREGKCPPCVLKRSLDIVRCSRTMGLAIIFLLLSPLRVAIAQSVHLSLSQLDHRAWTAKDGAPIGIVAIQQDRDGSLWLGTDGGLYNFNGITFTSFESQPGDTSFPTMPVDALYIDKSGDLWVGFGIKGIAVIRNHHVIHLYGDKDGLPPGTVDEIFQAPDGAIVACARGRLVRLDAGRWKDMSISAPLSTEPARAAAYDYAGALWIMTDKSVWRMSADGKVRKILSQPGIGATFAQAPNKGVWMITSGIENAPGYVLPLNLDTSKAGHPNRLPIGGNALVFDRDGALWTTSDHGLRRIYNPLSYLIRPRPQDSAAFDSEIYTHRDGLTSDVSLSLFEDNLGDIWTGTEKGLDRFTIPHLIKLDDEHTVGNIALTACPDGTIWLDDGIYFNGLGGPLTSLQSGKLRRHGPPRKGQSLHCDQTGVIWLNDLIGISRYSGGHFAPIGLPKGVPMLSGRQSIGGSTSPLFESFTRNGLWKYADRRWSRVIAPGFPNDTPYSIFMDRQGRLWTGYIDNRIAMLDANGGHIFIGDPEESIGIVECFLESSHGLLVGGSGGISTQRGQRLYKLLVKNTASLRGISGLLEAENGDVWANGLQGIVRIPAYEIVKAIHSSGYRMQTELFSQAGINGPSPQVFAIPSAVKDANGIFWFSTSGTLVSLNPNSIHTSSTPPILGDLAVTVDGRSLTADHKIAAGYHTIRISYFGSYLAAPEKVTYRYKLDGADTGWQDVATRTEAVYTGLRPGTYRFFVSASNGEGAWTPPDGHLVFTVLPSFYQTPTFYSLCVASAIGIALLIFHLRVRSVAKTVRRRADIRADERIRIARDLHDTLLQGVQSLILRVDVAAKDLPDRNQTKVWLEDALLIADRVLAEGRDRVGHLRPDYLDGVSLLNAFHALEKELSAKDSVQYSVIADGKIRPLQANVKQELYYIGREAITNAFRHARASTIRVHLCFHEKAFVLRVADNGSGFDMRTANEKARDGHFGLVGMRERAAAAEAVLEWISDEGKGTEVIVSIQHRRAYSKRVPHV